MSDLCDPAMLLRDGNQFIRLGHGSRQRLFNQDIDGVLHQVPRDFEVGSGGNRNRTRLYASGNQFVDGPKCGSAEFAGYRLCAREVGVHDPDEFDILRRIGLKVAIDARVIAAEGPGADDSGAQDVVAALHIRILAYQCAITQSRFLLNVGTLPKSPAQSWKLLGGRQRFNPVWHASARLLRLDFEVLHHTTIEQHGTNRRTKQKKNSRRRLMQQYLPRSEKAHVNHGAAEGPSTQIAAEVPVSHNVGCLRCDALPAADIDRKS